MQTQDDSFSIISFFDFKFIFYKNIVRMSIIQGVKWTL